MPAGGRGPWTRWKVPLAGLRYATGPSPDDARMVESRRGQRVVLVLRDGAWKVSEWTATANAPVADAGATR